jgi:hypothetical protein
MAAHAIFIEPQSICNQIPGSLPFRTRHWNSLIPFRTRQQGDWKLLHDFAHHSSIWIGRACSRKCLCLPFQLNSFTASTTI